MKKLLLLIPIVMLSLVSCGSKTTYNLDTPDTYNNDNFMTEIAKQSDEKSFTAISRLQENNKRIRKQFKNNANDEKVTITFKTPMAYDEGVPETIKYEEVIVYGQSTVTVPKGTFWCDVVKPFYCRNDAIFNVIGYSTSFNEDWKEKSERPNGQEENMLSQNDIINENIDVYAIYGEEVTFNLTIQHDDSAVPYFDGVAKDYIEYRFRDRITFQVKGGYIPTDTQIKWSIDKKRAYYYDTEWSYNFVSKSSPSTATFIAPPKSFIMTFGSAYRSYLDVPEVTSFFGTNPSRSGTSIPRYVFDDNSIHSTVTFGYNDAAFMCHYMGRRNGTIYFPRTSSCWISGEFVRDQHWDSMYAESVDCNFWKSRAGSAWDGEQQIDADWTKEYSGCPSPYSVCESARSWLCGDWESRTASLRQKVTGSSNSYCSATYSQPSVRSIADRQEILKYVKDGIATFFKVSVSSSYYTSNTTSFNTYLILYYSSHGDWEYKNEYGKTAGYWVDTYYLTPVQP